MRLYILDSHGIMTFEIREELCVEDEVSSSLTHLQFSIIKYERYVCSNLTEKCPMLLFSHFTIIKYMCSLSYLSIKIRKFPKVSEGG
jgi:hypothetical protein